MEKIWLSSYEQDVQAEIDVLHYRSIVDVIDRSVEQYSNQIAFYNMGAGVELC